MALQQETLGDPLAVQPQRQAGALSHLRRRIREVRRVFVISDEVLPYSPCFEVKFFFAKGIPLGLASLLNWGIPPLLAMVFAGHTESSAHLQASLGYGRVWFNTTILMPTFGLGAYFSAVIPGCIGADRDDRIPCYLQRSTLLTLLLMMPIYAMQFAAGSIMRGLGVPAENCADVRDYCRMMVVSGVLIAVVSHVDTVVVNLGFTKSAALNSFLTGLGVDVACTYLFIFRWGWGVHGAALAQILVQFSRGIIWIALLYHYGLLRKTLIMPVGSERLFNRAEFWEFLQLGTPQILGNFSGWLIFEFQIIAMTNIPGITKDALAAGAIWVQVESSLASAQDGWIRSTSMRSLNLLGKQDPGAAKAYAILTALSFLVVAVSNVPFMCFQKSIASAVSNDVAVQRWLYNILWILVVHTLSRIAFINSNNLFVPLGRGMLGSFVTFFSFWCVATPISCAIAFTSLLTDAVGPKMVACVGATSFAQTVGLCIGFFWLWRLDWHEAGAIINRRANMDKRVDDHLARLDPSPL